jgi:hypothetical protein
MPLDDQLLAAYRDTRYHVRHAGGIDFYIDKRSDELAALHDEKGVGSSAFITAWNPRSEETPREENDARNERLRRDLEALGLSWIGAEGIGPTGWREESFLVLGISLEDATALARKYAQNAIVFTRSDGVPRLEVTRA